MGAGAPRARQCWTQRCGGARWWSQSAGTWRGLPRSRGQLSRALPHSAGRSPTPPAARRSAGDRRPALSCGSGTA
eukprot:6092161-Pyramimonas_sp.AAC.1